MPQSSTNDTFIGLGGFVSASPAVKKEHIFQKDQTGPWNGDMFNVGTVTTMTVFIYGWATAKTVEFYHVDPEGIEKGLGGQWVAIGSAMPLRGVNLTTMKIASSTVIPDGSREVWQFDLTGLNYIYMRTVNVEGGVLQVRGYYNG